MQSICIVEDEDSLLEMIRLNLELEGYDVTSFSNGKAAMDHFRVKNDYSLIILDVMLPNMSGVDICKNLRTFSATPVLFLSAKGTTADRIEGLKAGGNDYLPKPFDLEELLLRVAILTNKPSTKEEETIGDLTVNFKTFELRKSEEVVGSLSKKEIDLLKLFIEKEGEVVSRAEILDKVWGADQFPTSRTVDNFILNFRKLLETNPKEPQFFHSVRGVGYKFTR